MSVQYDAVMLAEDGATVFLTSHDGYLQFGSLDGRAAESAKEVFEELRDEGA